MTTDKLTDLHKRRTLKLLGGSGAGAVLATTSIPALAAVVNGRDGTAASDPASAPNFSGELQLTLISSPDVVENTFLLRNPTASAVSIDSFLQGSVVFGDRVFDCSKICADGPVQLKPFAQVSFQVPVYNVLAHPVRSYLVADEATWGLPHGTQVVSLSAHMSGSEAVLSLRPLGGHELITRNAIA